MKKSLAILLFFLISFNCVFLSGYAFSSTKKEDITEGIELFHSGNFLESYQVLIKVFEQYPVILN